jgi:transcriptional regulator GlxA family with amidase domain
MTESAFRLLRTVLEVCTPDGQAEQLLAGISRLRGVIDLVNTSYPRKITRREMADVAGLSENRFDTVFASVMAVSPMRYLSNIRLRHAQLLLATTDQTVTEIAESTGHSDVFYFSRRFKQKFGTSPSMYRQSMLAEPTMTERGMK